MKYRFNIQLVQSGARNLGLVLVAGGVFHGSIENGSLLVSAVLAIIGMLCFVAGTLEKPK